MAIIDSAVGVLIRAALMTRAGLIAAPMLLASQALSQSNPTPTPTPTPTPAPAPTTSTQPATPPGSAGQPEATAPKLAGVAAIRAQAKALLPHATSPLARAFLTASDQLPGNEPRTISRHKTTRVWYTQSQADALPEADRAQLEDRPVTEDFYYNTKYGSPLAYARPLEILAGLGFPTPFAASLTGVKILDFGYGGIGHLRLLGSLGADITGVDVDPLLPVLYSDPTDQGAVPTATGSVGTGGTGKVTMVHGRWPAEAAAKDAVGGSYDLIISKNTLKNGYLHPAQPVDKRMLVDLGVNDEQYITALHQALKPGGYVMIYNLCPAPAPPDKPYMPWADGKCPFPRESLEKAGFEVVAFDAVDDGPARDMARALGWDEDGMDVEKDLFCWYTVMRRR
ncbi:MAG: hypothetical protein IT435_19960 [Phycisphaerales bacterium]|nr:hypothetical protein [Phycisphaerales bacterium]